jgi:hypothetical protein
MQSLTDSSGVQVSPYTVVDDSVTYLASISREVGACMTDSNGGAPTSSDYLITASLTNYAIASCMN